jgi:hypothetical protein
MSIKTRVIRKVLSEAQKLINKKKSRLRIQESLKKKGPRIQAKSAWSIKYKFKQKPKIGGGQEHQTQRTTHYGPRGAEMKVGSRMARRAIWHDTRGKGSESWKGEMERMYGGVHMAQDSKRAKKSIKLLIKNYNKRFKKKKVVKALRGALIKKGTKLAYKLATKKYPQIFKKRKLSTAELKTKKIMKTPELAPLGVTKLYPHNLRKLAVAEVTKDRIRHLGNLAIKHNKKAVSLFWGKAKNINQIIKLGKYHKHATKKKLESLGKQYENLTKYQETIKAKTATKHSEGGEVVFGKNVDRSLL